MFYSCNILISLNISNFNIKATNNMENMFAFCSSIESIILPKTFTSNYLYYMNGMFQNCSKLTSLDLSNFKVQRVRSMAYTFKNCNSLTSLDLSNFMDTYSLINTSEMFSGCTSLYSLNISNLNTQNDKSMHGMFYNCLNLTSLDLNHFDTTSVIDMSYLFANCELKF